MQELKEKSLQVQQICRGLRNVSGPMLLSKTGDIKKAIDLVVDIQAGLIAEMEEMQCQLKTTT